MACSATKVQTSTPCNLAQSQPAFWKEHQGHSSNSRQVYSSSPVATATTSESTLADNGRVDTGTSSVALRAPCDVPVSAESSAACICSLDCLLIFIPTSLLSKLTRVGVAVDSGTGGKRQQSQLHPWLLGCEKGRYCRQQTPSLDGFCWLV